MKIFIILYFSVLVVAVLATATVGFSQESSETEITTEVSSGDVTEVISPSQNDPSVLLDDARKLLKKIDSEYGEWNNKEVIASWKYESNLTDENLEEKIEVSSQAANYRKKLWAEVKAFPWKELQDEDAKRQFFKLSNIGEAALPENVII